MTGWIVATAPVTTIPTLSMLLLLMGQLAACPCFFGLANKTVSITDPDE